MLSTSVHILTQIPSITRARPRGILIASRTGKSAHFHTRRQGDGSGHDREISRRQLFLCSHFPAGQVTKGKTKHLATIRHYYQFLVLISGQMHNVVLLGDGTVRPSF